MTMKFGVLGPLEVSRDGVDVEVLGGRQRGLLALMLVNAGHVVPAKDIIEELWPDRAATVRQNTFHAQLARLRRQLQPDPHGEQVPLHYRAGGYALDVDPDDVDVTFFSQIRERALGLADADAAQAMALLRQGLDLWRGAALQDCSLGRRCQAAAARLDEARLQVHERLAESAVRHGAPASVVDTLAELAVLYPLRETLLSALMSTLDACGRRVEALAVFHQARDRFIAAVGVEPGELMQREHLRILQGAKS